MKDIPRKATLRKKGKQKNSQEQKNKGSNPLKEQSEPGKTKKIHHQTLKAMQRKKLAQQKAKMIEQSERSQKKRQINKNNEVSQNQQEKIKPLTKMDKPPKKKGKPKKNIDSFPKQDNLASKINQKKNNLQKQDTKQQKKELVSNIMGLKHKKNDNKPNQQPTKIIKPYLEYYEKYYQNIMNAEQEQPALQQDYLIFDKSKPQKYEKLLKKIRMQADQL